MHTDCPHKHKHQISRARSQCNLSERITALLQLFNRLSWGFSPVNFIWGTIHNSNEIQMIIQLRVLITPLPVAVLDSVAWWNAEENCVSLSFKGKEFNL